MKITDKLKAFFSVKHGTGLVGLLMVALVTMLGSVNAYAKSVPMLFNFEEIEFVGTFSYDDDSGITFPGYLGITAFDVLSLEVTHVPSVGVSSSWDINEAFNLDEDVGERIAVFFDAFGGGAIGATTDADPIAGSLSALFKDSVAPFEMLDFSSLLDDNSGDWKVVQGATRVVVGGGADRSFYTVSAVPLPAAAWLFGSGLIGLLGFARRKS